MQISDESKVVIPDQISVGKYADSRIQEILGLQAYIDEPRQGKAAAQQLPRHLRRRAVSHNPKRLPKRLRERHIREREKSGCNTKDEVPRRPSRKYRRRPRNLLQEYNRRQRTFKWLETHIWHAKRFHMSKKWGWQVPDFPNDKCFRALYRASAKKSIIQDVSYYSCLELKGDLDTLQNTLGKCTASAFFDDSNKGNLANYEGHAVLYHPQQYPHGVIGEVSYLCKSQTSNETDLTMWIWMHPAIYKTVKDLFLRLFEVTEETVEEISAGKAKKMKLDPKLETKNVPSARIPRYKNSSGVVISDLTGTLNRFRLVGPLSTKVLGNVMRIPQEQAHSHGWKHHQDALKNWNNIVKLRPGQFRSGTVIGLVVRDPRLFLPSKRGCIDEENIVGSIQTPESLLHQGIFDSPIWNEFIRDTVTENMKSCKEINQQRSEMLLPGSDLPPSENESRVPVLLVQQPGRNNFGAGWDVILPSGWGMAFWMNFVFQGVMTAGLRDAKNLCFEMGSLDPVSKFPESQICIEEKNSEAQLLKELYFRRPPDKRCNYIKLAVQSPFKNPWETITESDHSSFFVIRDANILKRIAHDEFDLEDSYKNALIPVRVQLKGKGSLSPFSMICLPNQEDVDSMSKDPVEPDHLDTHESARKTMRENHKKTMNSLRRKWKKAKDTLKELKAESVMKQERLNETKVKELQSEVELLKQAREKESHDFNENLRDLWLPSTDQPVRNSKLIIGYVVEGAFSFRIAATVGIGFVSLSSLIARKSSREVLVRQPSSKQYRFASMEIL